MKTRITTRTTEVTVERHEIHVIARIGKSKVVRCAECGREIPPAEANGSESPVDRSHEEVAETLQRER